MLNLKHIRLLFTTLLLSMFVATSVLATVEGVAEADDTKKEETVTPAKSTNTSSSSGGGDIFSILSNKAAKTLSDLRPLVYMISGFGLIAFAYAAIFNKISWKHLSQIGIGLFLVACMAPFIEYFTYGGEGDGSKLSFGTYIQTDFEALRATDELTEKECVKGPDGECQTQLTPSTGIADGLTIPSGANPADALNDVIKPVTPSTTDTAAKKSVSIKNVVSGFKNVVQGVESGVSAAKTLSDKGENIYKTIKNADSLSDIANGYVTVTNDLSSMNSAAQYGTSDVLSKINNASNDFQDSYATKEDRADNAAARKDGTATNATSAWAQTASETQKDSSKATTEWIAEQSKKATDNRKIYQDAEYIYNKL
ncbi:MAG: hypothetical protein LBL47_04175 [Lactobacillus sp.]|jgi:hypothetical protein|nr:hypothetical protein [Lactobacillus sp.]